MCGAVHFKAVRPLTSVRILLFSRVKILFLMSSGSESNPGVCAGEGERIEERRERER